MDPMSEVSAQAGFSRNVHFNTNVMKPKKTILSNNLLLNKKYLVLIFDCNNAALGINYQCSMK